MVSTCGLGVVPATSASERECHLRLGGRRSAVRLHIPTEVRLEIAQHPCGVPFADNLLQHSNEVVPRRLGWCVSPKAEGRAHSLRSADTRIGRGRFRHVGAVYHGAPECEVLGVAMNEIRREASAGR